MENEILGGNALTEPAVHLDATHLELVHGQALAGQHIPHLTGADAKRNGTEGAMG